MKSQSKRNISHNLIPKNIFQSLNKRHTFDRIIRVFTDYMKKQDTPTTGIQNKLPHGDTLTKPATETYVNEFSVISLFQIMEYGRIVKIG